ncbi:MAG: hypothetical protein IIC36_13755, partial [Gemmatimonadetes bacterium]|nr:hypothetical protein [Gemmatimonadota bacterium]
MAQFRALGRSLLCVAVLASPVWAQDGDRIWGRLYTTSGDVHEGFIRWDRNEGSWVDILDGSKEIPAENYMAWLEAKGADGPPLRFIDLQGFRISWREADPDFPSTAASGIRFGHLRSLRVVEDDRVELTLRSGEVVELDDRSRNLGRSNRGIVVDVPGRSEVDLRWRDLDRIDFSAAPPGVRARAHRLYGTVEDVQGNRYTGYVSWDLDEIMESDVLDGEEMEGGRNREIRFGEIASIARIEGVTRRAGGARVVLVDGDELDLTGDRDVDRRNRGIQISDPGLGLVEVEWEEFRILRFHEADAVVGYDAFDGGHPLVGTLVTQSGEEIDGLIRWDADEGGSWEFLNGRADDVIFTVEFGQVSRITRGEVF